MLSVLIPVFNEAEILAGTVATVHAYLIEFSIEHEIIVTSNGSTDETNTIGRRLAGEYPWFRFFELPERGVGTAFRHAVEQARSEHLICLDADLAGDLSFLLHANDLLKYADMVVGSKTMGDQRRSLHRIVASQLYIAAAQFWFDMTISDYSLGCKGFRRSAILPALPHIEAWTGYVFELALFLKRRGANVIQIGIDCNDRRKSHFNLFHEGFHRFRHLARCYRILNQKSSWFQNP